MTSSHARLDVATWNRRHHFEFFRDYDKPFFNVCVEVDVSTAIERSRQSERASFFATTLHASLLAANDIEPFRYRLDAEGVRMYETIGAGSTILRDDETFGFGYFDFDRSLDRFAAVVRSEIANVRDRSGPLDERPERDDLIHYSILPWIPFTAFSHARRNRAGNSVPKIVFGQRQGAKGAEHMPVSVEVHHALVDGLHVARFLERFQRYLDGEPGEG